MYRGFRCCSTAAAPTLTFEDEQTATLRTELGALSFTALQRRAAESGLGQGEPPTQVRRNTKHAMLSYQWDHQERVQRVHGLLSKLGRNVWMDINGGMGVDVYDSMAEGVSSASVVVLDTRDGTACGGAPG